MLTVIPSIDRDIHLAHEVSSRIQGDILVVTRETDVKTIDFWKSRATVITVPHYEIHRRHNLERLAEKMNIAVEYFKLSNHDTMMIVESDILLNPDTVTKHQAALKTHDVVLSYYDVPWAGKPVICSSFLGVPYMTSKVPAGGSTVYGSGTGACSIKRKVLERVPFTVKDVFNIKGQDVGFFLGCAINRFKVFMCDDKVEHKFKNSSPM